MKTFEVIVKQPDTFSEWYRATTSIGLQAAAPTAAGALRMLAQMLESREESAAA